MEGSRARREGGTALRAGWPALLLALVLALGAPALAAEDLSAMDLEDLMQIEVSIVSKQSGTVGDSPAAVTVISAEDIRRSGAKSIPELLRGVPGLHVAQIDANHWSVASRGFADEFSNKLLVMVDGRPIYTPSFSGVYWNSHDLMLEDIARIEVVRGPGGTLWGANAVNGVIHVITKSAEDTQGALVAANGGSYEKLGTTARYGHALSDDAHVRVYGKYADRDDFESPMGGSADDDRESWRTGARFDWDIADGDRLTIQGDYFDGENDRTLLGGFPNREKYKGGNVVTRFTHTVSETSEVSLQGFWDYFDYNQVVSRETRNTFDVELQHSFQPLARNLLVWGAGYRATADDLDPSLAITFENESRQDDLISFFVQDELTVVPELLSFTLGTKLEHNDYTGFEYQPSGRILLTPSEHHTFWGAVSRAVRTPSRVEDNVRFFQQNGPTTFTLVTGGHDSDSEDLLAYELGFRSTPHRRVNVDVAGFYNDYERLRSVEMVGAVPNSPFLGATTNVERIDNELEGSTWGVELASTVQVLDAWQLSGSYTFTRLDLKPTSASNDTTSEDIENRTPRHQFGIRSRVDLPWDFELDTAVFWVDRLKNQGVSSYTRVDARLAWEPTPGLELSLVGLNLAEEHSEFGNGLVTQASEVPRSVYGNVRWEFQ